jgi:hypothetical protein
MNDDGTMARVPDLIHFCKQHRLLMITVAELARYRLDSEYEELLIATADVFPMTVAVLSGSARVILQNSAAT